MYLTWDEAYTDWQWIEVAEGKANHMIQLRLDPSQAGQLVVQVAESEPVFLVPLDERGEVPVAGDSLLLMSFAHALGLSVEPENGIAQFASVRPGTYRMLAGGRGQDVTIHSQQVTRVELGKGSGTKLRRLPAVLR